MQVATPRVLRARFAAPLFISMFALGVLAGCQTSDAPQGGSVPSASGKARGLDQNAPPVGDADQFLTVDCLLPARVKQLGSQVTYLGDRRAIKTSARDCEIRGGEYVAYDRADYRTALKVWLRPAEKGDAKAQTYVGEILERGVGGEPDYAGAAKWYRRAAEQGYAPAMINLGQLHEQGLGVEKDPVLALNLYRQAAGFDEAGLTFVTSADVGAELQDLRAQVTEGTREADRLRAEIKSLETRLTELQTARERAGGQQAEAPDPGELQEIEEERAALEAERERLEEERAQAQATRAELERTKEALEQERLALKAEEEQLNARREEAAGNLEAMAEVKELLADLRRRQEAYQERSEALEERARAFDARETKIAEQAANLEAREAQLGEREAELEAYAAKLREREGELAEREQAIDSKQAALSDADGEIAELRRVIEEQRRQLAALSDEQEVALAPPEITLLDPELPASRTRGLPVVRTRAGVPERPIVGRVNAPAGLLSLIVNDQPQEFDDKHLFETSVPVERDGTQVSIVAIDEQGRREDLEFVLAPEDQAAEPKLAAADAGAQTAEDQPVEPPVDLGEFHALVIGNNEFEHLPPLETAINDARAVADVLESKYGFHVTVLENANRYQILSALNHYRSTLTEDDNLLIYYAGHGELDEANMRGHWLPVDAEPDNTANWISNVAITDILNAMSARRVLVVADSCYSGALTRSALAQLDSGMSKDAKRAWLKAMAFKRSRTALTSGGLAPTLDSGGGEHSVFAKTFLDVLRDNEGLIEGRRLFEEISARVTWKAQQYRFEQVPEYAPIKYSGHEAGEFFFVPEQA